MQFVAVLPRESEYHTPLFEYNTVGAPIGLRAPVREGPDGDHLMVCSRTSESHLVAGWACRVGPRRSASTVYETRTSTSISTGKSCSGRSLT